MSLLDVFFSVPLGIEVFVVFEIFVIFGHFELIVLFLRDGCARLGGFGVVRFLRHGDNLRAADTQERCRIEGNADC